MAFLLIVIRTHDTILDKVAFSKDLARVNFDTSEIGLAFRNDPCSKAAQYFVVHSVLKRNEPNLSTVEEEEESSDEDHNQSTEKSESSRESQEHSRPLSSAEYRHRRRYTDRKTSLSEFENGPECTCKNMKVSDSCKACTKPKLIPHLSFVLLDLHYVIVTKLRANIAHRCFKELICSGEFRERFLNFIVNRHRLRDVSRKVCRCESVYKACSLSLYLPRLLEIHLEHTFAEVPYSWDRKVSVLVHKRMLLEETMAWLSTLGGGYSSLGDYFLHFSEQAGKISLSQLRIAIEMGDPIMAAKCRLFFALSLMQRGHLRLTKKFIREQYKFATKFKVCDPRLIDMCKGLWNRLQYMYVQRRQRKLSIASSDARNISSSHVDGRCEHAISSTS